MTAMCDVAFLLLTFFILTATAKHLKPLPGYSIINSSNQVARFRFGNHSSRKKEGKEKVFFGVKGKEVRKAALEYMAQKYKMEFTDAELDQFALIDEFGVPMEGLKQLIAMKNSDRNRAGVQPGVPCDSINNQLNDWILYSRKANIDVNQKELQFAIKGDAKEMYPEIKKIMDILQDQKINNFNLVTGLRGKIIKK
jgi:hypothetical protein